MLDYITIKVHFFYLTASETKPKVMTKDLCECVPFYEQLAPNESLRPCYNVSQNFIFNKFFFQTYKTLFHKTIRFRLDVSTNTIFVDLIKTVSES